jgi:hypothetical protein
MVDHPAVFKALVGSSYNYIVMQGVKIIWTLTVNMVIECDIVDE